MIPTFLNPIRALLILAVPLLCVSPAHADARMTDAARRVEASLRMPSRLLPRPYLEVVTHPRERTATLHAFDPAAKPMGETGRWKAAVPVKVEVFAVVATTTGSAFLLFLDNFSLPVAARSTVDPFDLVQALHL